ncbi:hypothetical protein LP316_02690 [Thalassotalea sp. LPB0316]|uniref:hypothetical protein n=1 Tax=Thalassotalea sp. LPB0316 TaxID=2769490 RepID=UPI0018677CB7|nr:hypothetical protein [Thalassotalea sp. LPB0316]QOL26227.1 hypothetical protein LP316_02690 [Thalassotalea sp. LPB0316]
MWKSITLIITGVIGLIISMYTFQKGSLTFSDIASFFNGEKTFYQVFVEPQKPLIAPSRAKSYKQSESFENTPNTCLNLNNSRAFIAQYLRQYIDLDSTFTTELQKVTLLKSYFDTLQNDYYIGEYEFSGQKALMFHSAPVHTQMDCAKPLNKISDIVYKIASNSSRQQIKEFSGYIEGNDSHPFENEQIMVSHPFVFQFSKGKLIDFKYKALSESNYANHYLDEMLWPKN